MRASARKPRLESGLDCLLCAKFARQRTVNPDPGGIHKTSTHNRWRKITSDTQTPISQSSTQTPNSQAPHPPPQVRCCRHESGVARKGTDPNQKKLTPTDPNPQILNPTARPLTPDPRYGVTDVKAESLEKKAELGHATPHLPKSSPQTPNSETRSPSPQVWCDRRESGVSRKGAGLGDMRRHCP